MKKIYSLLLLVFFVSMQASFAGSTTCSAGYTFTISGNSVLFVSAQSPDSTITHQWYFGDGYSSTAANPVHSFWNCGTYTVYHQVEQVDNNGMVICMDSTWQTVVVTVCNTPCGATASFNALMVNNQTNVYEFVNNSTVAPNSPVSCTWYFGDGMNVTTQTLSNQVHTYASSGLFNVCLVVISGTPGTTNVCRDTFCMNVQAQVPVTPCNLVAGFTNSSTASQNTVTFINTSTGLAAGDSIRWTFGDGTVSYDLNPTHTFSAAGTYTVCLRISRTIPGATTPCVSEICHQITVTGTTPCSILPNFTYQIAPSQSNVVIFTSTSIAPAPYTVTWSFGDNTTGTGNTVTHTYSQPGIYTVCIHVVSGNSCSSDSCGTVIITSPQPCNLNANFTTVSTSSPNTLGFVNATTGFSAGDSIRWTFGDGSVSYDLNPTHTFAVAGTYTVCLRVVSNLTGAPPCVSEICHQVVVTGTTPCSILPNFTYQISQNQSNIVTFTNTSVAPAPYTATWYFGDSSTATGNTVTHIFNQPGTYTVCMHITSANGCTADSCGTVVISSVPQPCNMIAGFTYTATSAVNTFAFVNTSTGFAAGDSIRWSFGDGTYSYDVNPTHTYAAAGNYQVCLRIKKNPTPAGTAPCVAELCYGIVVGNPCSLNPSFSYQAVPNQNGVYVFTNTSITANAPLVTWSFGDSTNGTGNVVTHTFSAPGTYTVCMQITVNNTCSSDTCITITVTGNPQPCNISANYSWQNSPASPNVIYFLNASAGLAPGDSILWNFGDGTISHDLNPVHTYAASGSYVVCLRIVRVSNSAGSPSCVSEICHPIIVPVALVAYPNPATNVVNVNVPLGNATPIYAFVYNAQNVLVAQTIVAGVTGSNTITFNTSNLAPGYYTIRIYYNGQFTVARFLKL